MRHLFAVSPLPPDNRLKATREREREIKIRDYKGSNTYTMARAGRAQVETKDA